MNLFDVRDRVGHRLGSAVS